MKRYPQLRHSEEGLASISLQGEELCITLGRALMLDDTHQAGGPGGMRKGAGKRPAAAQQAGVPCRVQASIRAFAHCKLRRLPGRHRLLSASPDAAAAVSVVHGRGLRRRCLARHPMPRRRLPLLPCSRVRRWWAG